MNHLRTGFLSELTKVAVIGPMTDMGLLGLPSIVGYQMGKRRGREMVEGQEEIEPESFAAQMVIPGRFGYRMGIQRGYYDALKELENVSKGEGESA